MVEMSWILVNTIPCLAQKKKKKKRKTVQKNTKKTECSNLVIKNKQKVYY